jgi:hypothetical protein
MAKEYDFLLYYRQCNTCNLLKYDIPIKNIVKDARYCCKISCDIKKSNSILYFVPNKVMFYMQTNKWFLQK